MNLGFRLYFKDKTVFVPVKGLQACQTGNTTIYKTQVDSAQVEWTHTKYAKGYLIDLTVTSAAALGIYRIDSAVAEMGVPNPTWHIAMLGRSATKNEIRFPHEFGHNQAYAESCVGLFSHLDGTGSVMAGVAPFKNVCKAEASKSNSGAFTFCVYTEFTEDMADCTQLKAERCYVSAATTIDELFTAYQNLLPQSHFAMPKLTGWNTWDYYTSNVTAEDVFENVDTLQKLPFADRLQYVVIDDGWQKNWGDWTENEKFACGIKAVADYIKKAGFIPGIWMAPVAVREDAAVFAKHADWFCQGSDGQFFCEEKKYYLDPTHPKARAFILQNYKQQYQAGYRLFKMDYISPLLRVKQFYQKGVEPYQMVADLVADVQANTGSDAVILGCSVPLECGADVTPSMRSGLDIHNHFSHVRALARSIAWAFMYNNKVTRIDPDFIVVRGEETSTEPVQWYKGARNEFFAPPRCKQTDADRMRLIWRYGDQFNALEAETWANLVAICGGNMFLSDRMSVLNQKALEILQNAFALAGDTIRPIYLKQDHRAPSLWKGDKGLLVINWEEIPRTIEIDGIDTPLKSQKPFTLQGNTLTVTLLPHESFGALYE